MQEESAFTGRELAEFWRVPISIIQRLMEQKELVPDGRRGDSQTFSHQTIDAFHSRHLAHNLLPFPSVAELLATQKETGQPALLKATEAAEREGIAVASIAGLIRANPRRVHAFRLSTQLRIVVTGGKKTRQSVALGRASELIGLTSEEILALLKQPAPPLQTVSGPGWVRVQTEGLMAYIAAHVAHGTAEEWCTLREEYDFDPLLSPQEIYEQFGIPIASLAASVKHEDIPCIYTPTGNMRIPLHVVTAWHAEHTPLTSMTLAELIGVSEVRAHAFIASQKICGRHQPGDDTSCPTPNCVDTYIEAHRTSNEPLNWLIRRAEGLQPLTGDALAAHLRQIGLTKPEIAEGLEEHEVRGFRLPDGELVMFDQDIRAFSRRLRMRNR